VGCYLIADARQAVSDEVARCLLLQLSILPHIIRATRSPTSSPSWAPSTRVRRGRPLARAFRDLLFRRGLHRAHAIIGMVTYVTLLERKFAARMQSRIGPYRVDRTACSSPSPTR